MTKRVFALFTAICLLCGLALGGIAIPAYASDSDPEDVSVVDGIPEGWVNARAGKSIPGFTVVDDPDESGNKLLKMSVASGLGGWGGIRYDFTPTGEKVTLEYRFSVASGSENGFLLPSLMYEGASAYPLLMKFDSQAVAISNSTASSAKWTSLDTEPLEYDQWHKVKLVVDISRQNCELYVNDKAVVLVDSSKITFDPEKYTQISRVLFGVRADFKGTVYLDDMTVTVGTSSEEVEEPVIENSLSLQGNIGVNYYISIPEAVKNDADAFIRFAQAGGTPVDTLISQGVPDGEDTRFTWPVAAKEMNDEITAQIFYGEDQSTEVNRYSVKKYAEYIQNDYTGEDKETWQKLMTAMLNYGALAQKQFNYNTDALVTDLTNVTFDVDADDLFSFKSVGTGTEKAKFCGTGLLLESGTTLRVYFKVADGAALTVNNGELTIKERGGYHYVDIENIYAPDLGDLITLTVNDGTENAEIQVCPLSYCYDALNGGTEDEILQNLVKALYQYYAAAVVAFQ